MTNGNGHLIDLQGINKIYDFRKKARNGKRYCAWELKNVSAANLRAWQKDCDLKVVVYDVDAGKATQKRRGGKKGELRGMLWAHWFNIVAIDGKTLKLQDYDDRYDVRYTYFSSEKYLDFGYCKNTLPAGRERFDDDDPKAGDGPGESIHFVVVCECDESWVETVHRMGPDGEIYEERVIRPPKDLTQSTTNIRFP